MKNPVVITIGYHQYLLPDDVGANTVIKCLSRAVPCRFYGGRELKLEEDKTLEVALAYVPKNVAVVDHDGSPLQHKAPKVQHGVRKLKSQHVPELKWNGDPRLL